MKRNYKITVIMLILLGVMHIVTRNSMPISPPNIVVKTGDKQIEAAKGEYNWFDGKYGGNSCLSGSFDNLVKTIKFVKVEKEQKIEFS